MKNLLDQFRPSRHIMLKSWLASSLIAVVSLFFISVGSQFFLRNYFLSSSLSLAESNTQSTAEALEDTLTSITNRFVDICGTTEFKNLFSRICRCTTVDYTKLNSDLQDTIHNLQVSNSLIRTVLITSKTGMVYHHFSNSLYATPEYSLESSDDSINGITVLPMQKSPFLDRQDVIPIAFPLTSLSYTHYVVIADDTASSDAIVFLLLDASMVRDFLHTYSDSNLEGTYSLITSQNLVVSTDSSVSFEEDLHALPNRKDTLTIKKGDSYLILSRIGNRNLCLANLISSDRLLASLNEIQHYIYLAIFIVLVTITVGTLITAKIITIPLSKLVKAVSSIENQTYSSDQILSQSDEIGQLSLALDSMYQTIQRQISELTQERQERYNVQIRIFSEQINPHFLYNTLEYINMEIYSNHSENASFMIQNLGDFMRIGLNFGGEVITISRELAHVQAYVNIMNHRFDHKIQFTSDVPAELLSHEILKIILQPLAENSIRHGFGLDSRSNYLDTPSIHIEVIHEDSWLFLRVIDNGSGIDIERATKILLTGTDGQKHVGLNNVYQRLRFFYGESAEITFSSVPYYENIVQIRIPFTHQSAPSQEENL